MAAGGVMHIHIVVSLTCTCRFSPQLSLSILDNEKFVLRLKMLFSKTKKVIEPR
jgi:hypothetical protein